MQCMAKNGRRNSRRGQGMKKIEPAVMTLSFGVPSSVSGTTSFIDLSQVASIVNRRFYRQGLNWAVGGFKFIGGSSGIIQISKLPNTWVMANSWQKGMRAWLKMTNEALEETESVRARFQDFKIYADSDHYQLGFFQNLLPQAGFNAPVPTGDFKPGMWEASSIHVPNSTVGTTSDFAIKAVGANYNGTTQPVVSLIEGYANSRALPYREDPNVPGDNDDVDGTTPENWLSAIFNEGTDQIKEVLEDNEFENNKAPYPFEGDGANIDTMYPGGANQVPYLEIHDLSLITATTVGGITRIKGGNFPCGLIRIDASGSEANLNLQIDLVPGNHRGYLCESMTEM